MRDPFYGWTSVLHKSVQVCCERFLFHLCQMRPHVLLTFSHGLVDLNDGRRVLQRQETQIDKTQRKNKIKCQPCFGWKSGDPSGCADGEPLFAVEGGLSQMSKDDTDCDLSVCKCWNETSKWEEKVLPLLSLDNRYASCLRRKQQTCGVFGLGLSVTGIERTTFYDKLRAQGTVLTCLTWENCKILGL